MYKNLLNSIAVVIIILLVLISACKTDAQKAEKPKQSELAPPNLRIGAVKELSLCVSTDIDFAPMARSVAQDQLMSYAFGAYFKLLVKNIDTVAFGSDKVNDTVSYKILDSLKGGLADSNAALKIYYGLDTVKKRIIYMYQLTRMTLNSITTYTNGTKYAEYTIDSTVYPQKYVINKNKVSPVSSAIFTEYVNNYRTKMLIYKETYGRYTVPQIDESSTSDTRAIIFPWVELEELICDNNKRVEILEKKIKFKVANDSLIVFKSAAINMSQTGYDYKHTVTMKPTYINLSRPTLDVFTSMAADFGNLCPPRCGNIYLKQK